MKRKSEMKLQKIITSMVMMGILLAACGQAAPDVPEMILATTTSTQDSGLLDELIPTFQEDSGYIVQTVAVGSGQAMQMGVDCNADVLLVHSPAAEEDFMEAGNGVNRQLVMHNYFLVVGPASDPAGIKGGTSVLDAFAKIAESEAIFISRGDDSGTHKMELSLWEKAGVTPEGDWYEESGQGMGPTLTIASEKSAYTLTDRATYLANMSGLDQEILVEGDPALLNVYHVIQVNPEKCPKVNQAGAQAFADFIVAAGTQETIAEFGVEEFGQPLFYADAGKDENNLTP
jgi:tungstate transport system substrate-binding protein